MFARGISILCSSVLDPGSLPVPRPSEALSDQYAQAAMRAMLDEDERLSPSVRVQDPDRYRRLQLHRRADLESFLWIEPNQEALLRMVDLIDLISAENCWGDTCALFDDPFHPIIDLQAAETGVLFAWIHRRHGQRLAEISPRISNTMLSEVRRRLLSPMTAHSDYPFMNNRGSSPVRILSDLLISCLLLELSPSRRQQPVKTIMHLLDRICAERPGGNRPLREHLDEACALADTARVLKRLSRGEFDLTQSTPPEGWLDDVLIPWIAGEYFIDPASGGMRSQLSGMDIFRLGYLSRDKALCALGAQLHRANDRPAFSLTGRILSMEYSRAAQDESTPPPRLKRAETESGNMMLSRVNGMMAAIVRGAGRSNAGDIILFADSTPVLIDAGGQVPCHNLPTINGLDMRPTPLAEILTERNFGAERDVMSADLTPAYARESGLLAYQRTLMVMRADQTVRLVDAFEFADLPREVCFNFVCAQKPLSLRSCVRLGPVSLSWDGDMTPEIYQIDDEAAFPGQCYLLQLRMTNPPQRFICGFTFERN